MNEQKFKLVHNEMIPLTEEEVKQMDDARKLGDEKEILRQQEYSRREQLLTNVKSKLQLSNEETDILMNGI